MTVASETRSVTFSGNGTTTVFPYTFRIFTQNDLRVTLIDADDVATVQTISTHYTVTGANNPNGGNVTMLTAPATGERLVVEIRLPLLQPTDIKNQGAFFPQIHEDQFDRACRQIQQIAADAGSSLRYPTGFTDRWDAQNKKIINLADGVSENDAVNKGQLEEALTAAASGTVRTTWTFTGDNLTTDFSIPGRTMSSAAFFDVYISGVRQSPGDDYVIDAVNDEISFLSAPPVTGADEILVIEAGFSVNSADVDQLRSDLASTASGLGSQLVGFKAAGGTARTVQAKLRDTVSVLDFGAVGDGVADDVVAIQSAIDAVADAGGGTVYLPAGIYSVGPSQLNETVYSGASGVLAGARGCIVSRAGVNIIGDGPQLTQIKPTSASLTAILMLDIRNLEYRGFTVDSGWVAADAGHGFFTQLAASNVDPDVINVTFRDIEVRNVGSYGIGLQDGDMFNVRIINYKAFNTGGDGIDFKAAGPTGINESIIVENAYVENFGQRVAGSAGVDVRGRVRLTNITVKGVGSAAGATAGIRFRTGGAPDGRYSSLTNFYVEGNDTNTGVLIGSPDVAVSNGVVMDCATGIELNAAETSLCNSIVISCPTWGIRISSGGAGRKVVGCTAVSCAVGFRDEGTYSVLAGNSAPSSTTAFSASGGAAPTQSLVGNIFATEWLRQVSAGAGILDLQAVGDATDIDLRISAKGTGTVRFGAHSAIGAETVTGFITIKDSAGNTRKLAVVS